MFMRRYLAVAVLLPLVAACAARQSAVPEPGDEGSHYGVTADPAVDWRTALRGDTVEVEIVDRNSYYRVEEIRLEGPDGRTYPAPELTRSVVRDHSGRWYGRPAVGIGGAFGSHGGGLGVGLSFPLGNRAEPDTSVTSTEARIPLSEPDRYRAAPGAWAVEIVLRTPSGDRRVARIPAPRPAA